MGMADVFHPTAGNSGASDKEPARATDPGVVDRIELTNGSTKRTWETQAGTQESVDWAPKPKQQRGPRVPTGSLSHPYEL